MAPPESASRTTSTDTSDDASDFASTPDTATRVERPEPTPRTPAAPADQESRTLKGESSLEQDERHEPQRYPSAGAPSSRPAYYQASVAAQRHKNTAAHAEPAPPTGWQEAMTPAPEEGYAAAPVGDQATPYYEAGQTFAPQPMGQPAPQSAAQSPVPGRAPGAPARPISQPPRPRGLEGMPVVPGAPTQHAPTAPAGHPQASPDNAQAQRYAAPRPVSAPPRSVPGPQTQPPAQVAQGVARPSMTPPEAQLPQPTSQQGQGQAPGTQPRPAVTTAPPAPAPAAQVPAAQGPATRLPQQQSQLPQQLPQAQRVSQPPQPAQRVQPAQPQQPAQTAAQAPQAPQAPQPVQSGHQAAEVVTPPPLEAPTSGQEGFKFSDWLESWRERQGVGQSQTES